MAEIHHFDHGWVTPTVSYVLSVLGSLLGLTCAVRLRAAHGKGERSWWLILAALAIGGTGIWSMHFVAMLGFSVEGSPIRYRVDETVLSAVLAIAAVGTGLAIVFVGTRLRPLRIAVGGLFAGFGVAAMHYTGMAAMRLHGEISYESLRVAASIVIAVLAATVALWLTLTVQKPAAILASAMVMGVAVNGMHFTGMSAMAVRAGVPDGVLTGATATTLLIPIGVTVLFGVLGLVYALLAAPTDEDRAGLAYLDARLAQTGTAPAARPTGAGRASVPPPPVPRQRPAGRPSTLGSGWTYRDRDRDRAQDRDGTRGQDRARDR